jgi:hypothetical protein
MTAPTQEQTDRATKLGPFTGGLHNASGTGEFIENEELFDLTNLEVDTDGSLVNRPQINQFLVSGVAPNGNAWQFIGTYLPSDGRQFIVAYLPAVNLVKLIDTATNTLSAASAVTKALCCIQYANKLYVIATPDSINGGGYFDVPTPTTTSFTAAASMPRGEAVTQYRERIWIACGMSSTSNTSRFFFSAVGDPTTWDVNNYIDVAPGNGQKLVSLVRLGQDLVLFKEHSTHKFTYTTDPRKAELNEIDATIGVPAINCNVVYNNNTIYVLHDNAVYELFQYTYTRISALLNMAQDTDLDLFAKDQYGLTLHRDRLFVRYFKYLYVYSLRVKRWSRWVSDRKFSHLVVIPSATVGLDTAYTTSASQAKPAEAYSFQDVRNVSYTGNQVPTAPTVIGVADLSVTSTTPTFTPATGTAVGDWMYVFWTNTTTGGVATTVTPPAGWDTVLPRQLSGDLFQGTEYSIYRKKFVSGDTTFIFTASQSIVNKSSILTVRNTPDDLPVVGTPNGVNAVAGSITAFGVPVTNKSMVLNFFGGKKPANVVLSYTVSGASKITSVPVEGTSVQGWEALTNRVFTNDGVGENVTLTYTPADTSPAFGVSLVLPPIMATSPVNAEVFQGVIQTKTYDFDMPHAYKVIWWWGVALATSGKFSGTLIIPNANRNLTWREAQAKYGIYSVAIAAGQQWASNTPVVIPSTIYPTLGRYARKFIKMLRKVRFRQVYFVLTFDVVTNGGIADASLRIYDLTIFMKKKQTVVKETS